MVKRFSSLNLVERTPEGRRYIRNVIYPNLGPEEDDIYVITTIGDRYDKLAAQFYQNVDYWWVIAAANREIASTDSLCLRPGLQIRIPADVAKWQEAFEKLNDC